MIDLSTNVPAVDLAYSSAQLIHRSRIAAAAWFAWRGLELRPRDVVTCAGAQQGLMTALLALCRPNDNVLVEELTFPGMKAVAKQLGLRLQGIAIDEEGAIPASIDRLARSTGATTAARRSQRSCASATSSSSRTMSMAR